MTEENNNTSYLYRYHAKEKAWCFLPIPLFVDGDELPPIETWTLSTGKKATVHSIVYSKEEVIKMTQTVGSDGCIFPSSRRPAIEIFRVIEEESIICYASRKLRGAQRGFDLFCAHIDSQGCEPRYDSVNNPMSSWEEVRSAMKSIAYVDIVSVESHTSGHVYTHVI